MDSIPRLMKLNTTNYYEWSNEILAYLMTQNLNQFIESEPLPTQAQAEKPNHKNQKTKTAGMIFLCLDENNRNKIIMENLLPDPSRMWSFLKEEYQSSSPANRGRVFSRLYSIKFTNLDQYIKDTRRCLAYLNACNGHKEIIDWCLGEMIVSKLPNSMEYTISLLTSNRPMKTKHVLKTLEEYEVNMACRRS